MRLRRIFRYLLKCSLKFNKKFIINIAMRIPFSRFHKVVSRLFWGEEVINWLGCTVKVNPGETSGYYLYFLNAYEDRQIKKLIELCADAHIFVDVGANIGLISLPVAYSCPQLEIFAFEPCSDIAKKFQDNLKLNPFLARRIHLINKAVAEVDSNLYFRPSDNPETIETGRLVSGTLPLPTDYLVDTIRLDTFFDGIKRYPDIIKIDVEGAELRVLEGMSGLFNKGFPKVILIEVHPLYFSNDVLKFKTEIKTILEQSGYSLFWLNRQTWEALSFPEDWPGRLHILAVIKQ